LRTAFALRSNRESTSTPAIKDLPHSYFPSLSLPPIALYSYPFHLQSLVCAQLPPLAHLTQPSFMKHFLKLSYLLGRFGLLCYGAQLPRTLSPTNLRTFGLLSASHKKRNDRKSRSRACLLFPLSRLCLPLPHWPLPEHICGQRRRLRPSHSLAPHGVDRLACFPLAFLWHRQSISLPNAAYVFSKMDCMIFHAVASALVTPPRAHCPFS
jgi:hypothetical protein